jgi:hypothetical protein
MRDLAPRFLRAAARGHPTAAIDDRSCPIGGPGRTRRGIADRPAADVRIASPRIPSHSYSSEGSSEFLAGKACRIGGRGQDS